MLSPQVIDLARDSVFAFDGDNIIDNTTQVKIGVDDHQEIPIIVTFFNLYDNSTCSPVETFISYVLALDIWVVGVENNLDTVLVDRTKYVGLVQESGTANNMRQFKINEFCVDNQSFEDVLMRLPYQVEIDVPGGSFIRWYDTEAHFGNTDFIMFEANAYEGGVGTTYATDASRVTHRGPVHVYP